jgi:hypothetical protein
MSKLVFQFRKNKYNFFCNILKNGFIKSILKPEAVDVLKRVQRVMHSNAVYPRSQDVVFKRINFAIQKRLAAQLVVRLPSIKV